MLKKLNDFLFIEDNEYKKYKKESLHQNTRMEEYRSEIM